MTLAIPGPVIPMTKYQRIGGRVEFISVPETIAMQSPPTDTMEFIINAAATGLAF